MDWSQGRRYDDDRRYHGPPRPSDRREPYRSGSYRSPPPRNRSPFSNSDRFPAPGGRRRSRSPAHYGPAGDSRRMHSSRDTSPRRGARSPPMRSRGSSRSPGRRSPIPRHDRRPRSPPRPSRPMSPRNSRSKYPDENNYRPYYRSPPPSRDRMQAEHTGRRSPPIGPSSRPNQTARPRSPRQNFAPTGPRHESIQVQRSSTTQYPGPDATRDRYSSISDNANQRPPDGPSASTAASRIPPSGLSSNSSERDPYAASRPNSASILSAPTGPRGASHGKPEMRESPPHSAVGPSPQKLGRPVPTGPSSYNNASPRGPADARTAQASGPDGPAIPSGPRGFRSSVYVQQHGRNQKYVNHLASLPSIIPGGKLLPPADPAAARKVAQLEEDAEKLRKQVDTLQTEKRARLMEWKMRERESRRDGLRSELAEAQLQALSGEVIGGAAF